MTIQAVDVEMQKYLPFSGNEEKTPDIEQYNKEIDDAMHRMDNGVFTAHEDVEKEMESW